ncbi:MAG: Ribosomal RNA small subunit methyltransferase A [Chlamydiales bacterium]|nr:Ribosomal RNA small subunit methyltransferase A [Chlamydiales bacterium]MCH9635813.1 Ribosomal RNA small subunit methyltransferase A [Chlamydiales bacterium]MCH9703940.1 16S rRNA (adenine(1518)-N(6)/adenine(1519)-N(6))-dimethyltransferase RsmA [Chlamydiota bacterium]
MTPAELKRFLASLDIAPLKRFSQNFLIDQNIVQRVMEMAQISEGDHVLEIGPGAGILTRALLDRGASVTAVEIDRTLAQEMAKLPITLIEGDVLKVELPSCDKVVSNLPYHLTSPIMAKLLPRYQTCTLFCQEEMGRRIVAKPGTKEYGSFTIFVQFYSQASYGFKVSKNCFYPAPTVDSCVIHFEKKEPPKVDEESFFEFVHTAFQGRRKKVSTTWKKRYGVEIDCSARPQELSLEEFLHYYSLIGSN